jgi:hypothetical protein
MSLPHVCECRICGSTFPLGSPLGISAGVGEDELGKIAAAWVDKALHARTIMGNEPERPRDPYGKNDIAGVDYGVHAKPITCAHGYTVCRPCKFPPAVIESDGLPYPLTSD